MKLRLNQICIFAVSDTIRVLRNAIPCFYKSFKKRKIFSIFNMWWWWWWIVFVVWLWYYFQSGPLSKILTIANLRQAASRIWTCAEPEFRLCWMKLCSSDNHYTKVPLCHGTTVPLNILVHGVINLLYYECWTEKQKHFYV